MLIIKRLNSYGRRHPGSVAALGVFDGIHRGHQGIIRRLVSTARRLRHDSVAITFEPPPQMLLSQNGPPRLLMSLREKEAVLEKLGVDVLAVIRFSPAVAAMGPREFVKLVLVDTLRASAVICGTDCGFGRGRSGDLPLLRELGDKLGFSVTGIGAASYRGEKISSTAIRRALTDGNAARATRMLGRPYRLTGTVVRGRALGRRLGYPTANVRLEYKHKLVPKPGSYAATAMVGNRTHRGMLYIGSRPTFGGGARSHIEFHALDGQGQFYGKQIIIDVLAYIRPETQFSGIDDLRQAIQRDETAIRRFFHHY